MTKEEIKKELIKSFDKVVDWLENHDDQLFDEGPVDKWTTSQQLDHIHKSSKAINKGMSMPKLMLRWKFGKANRRSRSFEALDKRYKERIKAMPKTFVQPMPPRRFNPIDKSDRIAKYRQVANQMIANSMKWSDKNLDKVILPHPALGKLTVRELLMWTVIHNEWHLKSLKENY